MLRLPTIGYRLRPWAVGSPQSLACLFAALAVCGALLLAPLLCVAHCALTDSGSAPHAHHHAAPAATTFHCELQHAGPEQPAPQPSAPLPRAIYELAPIVGVLALLIALLVRARPFSGSPLAPQAHPAPPERPPIG